MAATTTCPSCGASVSGNFCSNCGAAQGSRSCRGCQAELSPQARFCHRCGRPTVEGAATSPATPAAGARTDTTPWIIAAAAIVLLVGVILYKAASDNPAPPAVPAMANAGNAGAAGGATGGAAPFAGASGPAPDISRMTPRERFDRLFNRVMEAAERGDTGTVTAFTPMALGAYAQLDTVSVDARYHAAVLQMQIGDFAAARALADTILADSPGHLFAYVIRGTVAELLGDSAALAQARRDFAAHEAAETKANRVEYLEHRPVLERFRSGER